MAGATTNSPHERFLYASPLLIAALDLLVVGVGATVINLAVGGLVAGGGVIVGLVLLPFGPAQVRSIGCGLLVASAILFAGLLVIVVIVLLALGSGGFG